MRVDWGSTLSPMAASILKTFLAPVIFTRVPGTVGWGGTVATSD